MSDVSRLLKPATYLERMADQVIAGFSLRGSSPAAFNGLHLRLEEDSPYIQMLGGVEVITSLTFCFFHPQRRRIGAGALDTCVPTRSQPSAQH